MSVKAHPMTSIGYMSFSIGKLHRNKVDKKREMAGQIKNTARISRQGR